MFLTVHLLANSQLGETNFLDSSGFLTQKPKSRLEQTAYVTWQCYVFFSASDSESLGSLQGEASGSEFDNDTQETLGYSTYSPWEKCRTGNGREQERQARKVSGLGGGPPTCAPAGMPGTRLSYHPSARVSPRTEPGQGGDPGAGARGGAGPERRQALWVGRGEKARAGSHLNP